jgi:hypothetical protein
MLNLLTDQQRQRHQQNTQKKPWTVPHIASPVSFAPVYWTDVGME